jgi:hypothetical protein
VGWSPRGGNYLAKAVRVEGSAITSDTYIFSNNKSGNIDCTSPPPAMGARYYDLPAVNDHCRRTERGCHPDEWDVWSFCGIRTSFDLAHDFK